MNDIQPKTNTASLIIVSYNGSAYLKPCLDSVQKEIAAHGGEVIVVDNASTDGSADIVEQQYPDVTLIRNKTNSGFAAACNQGAGYATGDQLVFLNQDTQILPGWLSELLEVLEHDSAVALTTSKLLLMSRPNKINACGLDIHYTGLSFIRGLMSDSSQHSAPKIVSAVSGASFAIRRDVWEELEGFDEDLFMYYEETDLSWRAQLAGYKCLYVPTSISYHDYRIGQPSALGLYYSKRNRYIMLLKNWRWRTILLLLPSLVLAEILDWGHTLLLGKLAWQAKISTYRWLATNFSKIMPSRREVQTKRKVSDAMILSNRTHQLASKEVTGGFIGHLATTISDKLFLVNYSFARSICQALNL